MIVVFGKTENIFQLNFAVSSVHSIVKTHLILFPHFHISSVEITNKQKQNPNRFVFANKKIQIAYKRVSIVYIYPLS